MGIGTETAALIGTGISAAGKLAGSAIASSGQTKAANTQAAAANQAAQLQATASQNALDFQKQQYNDSVARSQPWLQAGQTALGKLQNLAPFQAPTDVTEQNDPGYQFRLAQGQKALQNQASARGGLAGGAALKAAQQYGQDYASGEYGKVYDRAMGQYQNQYNQLAGLSNTGQLTGSQLDTLGAQTAGTVSNTLMTGANNQAQSINNAAAARASGYLQSGDTWGQAAGGLGTSASNALIINSLRNRQSNTPQSIPWLQTPGDPRQMQALQDVSQYGGL